MKSLIPDKDLLPESPEHYHEPGPCLNCGTHLWSKDRFCYACGQKRLEREDMSFRHMIGESFLDYFHFDSGFFKTIIPLLFKPGLLTLEFMAGKRKSYVEPFKLFLVISVIYFLLLPLSGGSEGEKENKSAIKTTTTSSIAKKVEGASYTVKGAAISLPGRDSIKREIDSVGVRQYVETHYAGEGAFTKMFLRQVFKIMISTGQSFVTVLEHTASKMIFVLIPLFALLLKLIYIRHERLYYEHLIFSLHVHAFFFLFLIICMGIELLFPVSLFYVVLVFLVYGFLAMKKYYGESFGKSLLKMSVLSLSYLILALPVFVALLILVAVFLY